MKLSIFAKKLGVSYRTVWRLWKAGELDAYQLPTGMVIVKEAENNKDDLRQDFVSIITSFYARLYGLRRSKRKTEKIITELKNEKKPQV